MKKEVVTFRTDIDTLMRLSQMAADKEWSLSQVVDKICREYFKSKVDGLA